MEGMQIDGIKEVNTTDSLRVYKNARVLWPIDVPDDILDAVINEATTLLMNMNIDSQGLAIAEHLKKFMDERYEPFWHVVCGKHFGCYAIHENKRFIYFYLDNVAFMFYKSG